MAIYTSLFIASDADLTSKLESWKVPRDESVQRPGRNPFTGETIMVPSWDPDEAEKITPGPKPSQPSSGIVARVKAALGVVPPPGNRSVVVITGDYEDYLEGRAHPIVRESPHWCTKSVDPLALKTLFEVLDIRASKNFPGRPARIPPRGSNIELHELPAHFVTLLSTLATGRRSSIAARWAEELNEPTEHLEETIERLSRLSTQALNTSKNLYLMVEW